MNGFMVDERVHTGVDEAKHGEQTESCLVHYHNLYRHAPTRKYMSLVRSNGQSFRWGKGGNVTSAGWQVTLCEPTWHVSSRSGVATLRTAIHLLLTYLPQTPPLVLPPAKLL